MASYGALVRNVTPPLLWDFGKRNLPGLVRLLGGHYVHIRYEGDYPSFEAARQASGGYDAPGILARTREALLKVKSGEAKWERDAMVSDSDELPWQLLASLLKIAVLKKARGLRVIDFGGSLGSYYFWCKRFLPPELPLRWQIVEQAEHVKVGRADFANDELSFHFSIDEALAAPSPTGPADLLLLSGVVQCLPDPEGFLRLVTDKGIPHLILDRTPLWDRASRLTVQHVPKEIYEASYPVWFLSRERILSLIQQRYRLNYTCPDAERWELDGQPVYNAFWLFDHTRPAST